MNMRLSTILPGARAALRRAGLAGVAVLLLLSGCTRTLQPEPDLTGLPRASRQPLRVGVYYSPEFRGYEHARAFGSDTYVVPIGAASVEMLDRLLPRVFEEVVPLARFEPGVGGGRTLDAVIEPSIEAFAFRMGLDGDDPRFSIAYRFTAYDQDATPLATWLVLGDSDFEPAPFQPVYRHMGPDMRAAAEQLLAMFTRPADHGERPFAKILAAMARTRRVAPPGADALSLRAEAVTEEQAQKELFGTPIQGTGIIALRVRLAHRGLDNVVVQPWAARLVLAEGRAIPPASPSTVLARLQDPSYAGDVAMLMAGGLVGMAVLAVQESERGEARISRQEVLRAGQLQPARLGGEGASEGLLYFIPAAGTEAFDEARLRLWFARDGGEAFAVEVPVTGIGYAPEPPRQ